MAKSLDQQIFLCSAMALEAHVKDAKSTDLVPVFHVKMEGFA